MKKTLKIVERNKKLMKDYAEAFNHESVEKFINEQFLKDSIDYF